MTAKPTGIMLYYYTHYADAETQWPDSWVTAGKDMGTGLEIKR